MVSRSSAVTMMLLVASLAGCVSVSPQLASAGPASAPAASAGAPFVQASRPSGGTGSIAFIKAGDVWLAAPDGTGVRQLTHDGSQTSYHDPSQSPNGSIYVLRGVSTLYVLDRQTGAATANPVTLPTLENGARGLAIAPDGAHITYTTTGFGKTIDPRFGTPNGTFIYGGTDIATPDGTSVPGAALPSMIFASWLDASSIVATDGTKVYADTLGSPARTWVDKTTGCLTDVDCPSSQGPAANLSNTVASDDGRFVGYTYKPYFGTGARLIASVAGRPPAAPSERCALPDQQNFSDPGSFSPDGSAFAYDDTSFDTNTLESTTGQGIYVLPLNMQRADCGVSAAPVVLPGGAQPDWGTLAP